MNSLGSMVVRLVLDMAGYKPDLDKAVAATTEGASKIEGATGKAGAAVSRMGGALGEAAGTALELAEVGGYVSLGLLGAAAAAGAVGYASFKGAQEQKGFQNAIILTGNVSGTTASQMQAMAAGIDDVVGTQYQAAAALTEMAKTGQVAGQNLQGFAQVAIETERVIGTSVADTSKVFAQLGEEPVKASVKLNQSMNYLTAATFEQIKAADELGDKETAASLAQNAYATAMAGRTAQIKANLGTLERAWIGVKDIAFEAWDAMLGLGRQNGIEQQLSAQKQAVKALEEQVARGGLAAGNAQKLLDAAKERLATLDESAKLDAKAARWQADQVASEKAKISWMQEGEKYQTKAEKLEGAIAAIRFKGQQAGADELEIQKRINFEREKAAGKKDNSAQRELEKEAALLATLSGVNADYVEQLQRLQRMRDKGTLSELEYVRAVEQLIAKQPMAKKLLDDHAKALEKEEKANLAASAAHWKYIGSLDKGLMSLQDEVAKQNEHNERLGLSKIAVAELDAAKLELTATEQERQAIRALDKNLDESEYESLMKLAKANRELAKSKIEGAVRETGLETEKEIAAERKRGWEETDRQAREVFTAQELNADKVGKVLQKSIKSALYELYLKPIVFQVYASLTGGGVANSLMPGMSGGGGLNGLISTARTGNSIYDYGSRAYNWLFGGTGGDPTRAALYSDAGYGATGFAGGGSTTNAALYSDIGYTGEAASASSSTGALSGAGSSAMAFIPLLLAAYGANKDSFRVSSTGDSTSQFDASGRVINRRNQLFGGDSPISIPSIINGVAVANPQTPSSFTTNELALTDGHTQEQLDTLYAAQSATRDAQFAATNAAADNYTEGLNAAYLQAAKNLGVGAVGTNITFGTNDTRGGGGARLGLSAGSRMFDSGDITLNDADLRLAANRAILTALEGSELPRWMQGVFDGVDAATLDQAGIDAAIKSATDLRDAYNMLQLIPGTDLTGISFETLNSIKGMAGELVTVNTAFYQFGYTMLDVSQQGAQAAAGLASAFGGLQAMQAQFNSFAQNYLTQEEQQASTYAIVQSNLQKAGISVTLDQLRTATRQDIRAAVDSLHGGADTTEGAARYAAAVQAANTLAAIKPSLDAVAAVPAAVLPATSSGGGGSEYAVTDSGLDEWERAAQAIVDTMGDLRTTLIDNGPDRFERLQAQLAVEIAQAKAGDLTAMQDLPDLAKRTASAYADRYRNSTDQAVFNAQLVESLGRVVGVNPNAFGTVKIPTGAIGTASAPQDLLTQAPTAQSLPVQVVSPQGAAAAGGSAGGEMGLADLAKAMADLATQMAKVATNTGQGATAGEKAADILYNVTRGAPFFRVKEQA